MQENSSSSQSANDNLVQTPAVDFTVINDQVVKRAPKKLEKIITLILQNLNTQQKQMSNITDVLSRLSAHVAQQKQAPVTSNNTPS